MTNHGWPDEGIPMRCTSVEPLSDGEFWCNFIDESHGEAFFTIKTVWRPSLGDVWRLKVNQ